MTTRIRSLPALALVAGLFLLILRAPVPATAQCVGAVAVEDFAANMKGCAATVEFAARAATCAAGWHVCSSTEWAARFAGKTPIYNYWTNDNLTYDSSDAGCFVKLAGGNDCSPTPMRVCTALKGDRDGVYGTPTRFYSLQTLLPDGAVSLVMSIDATTLQVQGYAGPLSSNVFSGTQVGGPGSLTLTFTSGEAGTDGTAPFNKLVDPQILKGSDFTSIEDPLGNHCNWHNCGLDTAAPNLYFGGCSGNTTAGVLCCN